MSATDRQLFIAAERASYDAWLSDEQAPTPLPIPSTLDVEDIIVTVPVRISAGIVVMQERRLIRSHNPNRPHTEGTKR